MQGFSAETCKKETT